MRAAVEALHGEVPKAKGPSLADWSPEVERLTKLIDQVKVLTSVLIQVNSKKGTAAPKIEPEPRPESIWPRVQAEVRMRRHRDLVGRLLPGHRRTSDPPPPD